jgi:tRNA(fMet)-specific endonuclease VapC
MLVLDTDVTSLLQQTVGEAAQLLQAQITQTGEPVYVTIVTFQEQMRGRLAQCTKASIPEQYVAAARRLHETLEDYRRRAVLDFDDRAVEHFKRLKAARIRVGTMDLRIAAIVLANNATRITRNLSDFRKVPGLRAEDWTVRI